MANPRWRMLGEVLENLAAMPDQAPPKTIQLKDEMGRPISVRPEELQKGKIDLSPVLGRPDALRHVIDRICEAYDISPVLLRPYESVSLSGPVLIRPPACLGDDRSDLHRELANPNGVEYVYPKQHLACSRIYPLCFVVPEGRTIHTPEHRHPGSEILAVIEGEARQHVEGQQPHTLKQGELFHFCSELMHSTDNPSDRALRVWTFRELNPVRVYAQTSILGYLLRSRRIWEQKGIDEAAQALPANLNITTSDLKALEQGRGLPPPLELDEQTLRALARAYDIGWEILCPFKNNPTQPFVHMIGSHLNKAYGECHSSDAGITYCWNKSYLADSNVQPGVLRIAPFGRTPPHRHPGSEILLVLHGEARVHFPESCTTVDRIRTDEVLHFDASWIHSVINNGGTELVLWVLREFVAPQDLP